MDSAPNVRRIRKWKASLGTETVILGAFFMLVILGFIGALFIFQELMGISKTKEESDKKDAAK